MSDSGGDSGTAGSGLVAGVAASLGEESCVKCKALTPMPGAAGSGDTAVADTVAGPGASASSGRGSALATTSGVGSPAVGPAGTVAGAGGSGMVAMSSAEGPLSLAKMS